MKDIPVTADVRRAALSALSVFVQHQKPESHRQSDHCLNNSPLINDINY